MYKHTLKLPTPNQTQGLNLQILSPSPLKQTRDWQPVLVRDRGIHNNIIPTNMLYEKDYDY